MASVSDIAARIDWHIRDALNLAVDVCEEDALDYVIERVGAIYNGRHA